MAKVTYTWGGLFLVLINYPGVGTFNLNTYYSNTTGGAGTVYSSKSYTVFIWVRVTQPVVPVLGILDHCLSFCTLYFLFFFDYRPLIIPHLYLQTFCIIYSFWNLFFIKNWTNECLYQMVICVSSFFYHPLCLFI